MCVRRGVDNMATFLTVEDAWDDMLRALRYLGYDESNMVRSLLMLARSACCVFWRQTLPSRALPLMLAHSGGVALHHGSQHSRCHVVCHPIAG